MSPLDPPSASTKSPQFYPVEMHSEFGYLAPATGLRRRVALFAKGAVFGGLVGVIAVLALSSERELRVASVFNMQTQAADDGVVSPPVRFLASTMAMQALTPPAAATPTRVATRPPADTRPPVERPSVALAPEPVPPQVAPAPRQQRVAPKPKKKIARQPRRERPVHTEPDPRSAQARVFPPGPRRDFGDRGPFGFGW